MTLDPQDFPLAHLIEKHLPGKHNQANHGNGGGGGEEPFLRERTHASSKEDNDVVGFQAAVGSRPTVDQVREHLKGRDARNEARRTRSMAKPTDAQRAARTGQGKPFLNKSPEAEQWVREKVMAYGDAEGAYGAINVHFQLDRIDLDQVARLDKEVQSRFGVARGNWS